MAKVKVKKSSFIRECVEELKRVSWPTSKQVWNSTKVVVISTIVAAVILGLMDWVFTQGFLAVFN